MAPTESSPNPEMDPVIIIGAGLAGLVTTYELAQRNIPVVLIDQEGPQSLGGQAFWSLGGLFFVNSTEQRRMGIKDSRALALRDWLGSARFDRGWERCGEEDYWPRRWAEAFVDFAAGEMERYVKGLGAGFLMNVGWAERGDGRADGHGNSVPRFHVTWGAGPEVVRVFAEPVLAAEKKGLVRFRWRHVVDELIVDEKTGRAMGVRGRVLEDDPVERGVSSSRVAVDKFELRGSAVVIATGGIGGNVEAVKKAWPVDRLGPKVPESFVVGVPAHVDGRMMGIAESAGAHIINRDRMWHYTEGLQNWNPIWPAHGIRVLPAPSSLWLDATGKRLPPFLYPGSDTLATLQHICATGYDYTWFILNQSIIAREFALSGSEQNPDLTGKSIWQLLKSRVFSSKGTVPVQNFQKHGADFVVRDDLQSLVAGMNELLQSQSISGPQLGYDQVREVVEARDAQVENKYCKDAQVMLVRNGREYWPDSRSRIAAPHRILDPKHGPLIAVRMNLLTRKTLGGLETNLQSNVMREDGVTPFPGLYAAGEAAGFGGGGVHGYSSLEGTFLGGCIFSGRVAGRAISDELLQTKRARLPASRI
ncbi:FAD binding domain-containing protein [Nemania sp. FL0916]|nr:FAD binding domain-containing protein [Nemania sp. FL0916]